VYYAKDEVARQLKYEQYVNEKNAGKVAAADQVD